MPTIAALNIKVAMDSSQVTAGSAQVRKDVARLNSIMRQAKTDTQKYEEAKGALVRRLEAGQITMKKFKKLLAEVHMQYVTGPRRIAEEAAAQAKANEQKRLAAIISKRKADALKVEQQRLRELAMQEKQSVSAKTISGLGSAFSFMAPQALAASAALTAVYGSFRLLQDSIKLAADLEEVGVQFEVLVGNAESAGRLVADMRQLANTTALTFTTLNQASKTMLSFGVSSERVIPMLKQMGDITAGNEERMKMLSLAMSQSAAAGRLMGQDLLQMVNAGFNPLQEISRITGKSMLDLKKEMEEGRISFEMVALAMESATSDGGRFFNMLERSKGTLSGQLRLLNSDLERIKTTIGEELIPTIRDLAAAVRVVTDSELVNLMLTANRALNPLMQLSGSLRIIGGDFDGATKDATEAAGAITETGKAAQGATSAVDRMNEAMRNSQQSKEGVDAYKEELQALRNEVLAFQFGNNVLEQRKLIEQGLTETQANYIIREREKLELMQKQRQEQEEAAKEAKREAEKAAEQQKRDVEALMERGQSMIEQHNPVMAVKKQLEDLMVLLRVGAINESTFFKERTRILDEMVKKDAPGQQSALETGSKEAADFIQKQAFDKQEAQLQSMEKQRLLQEAQNGILLRVEKRLQELAPVRMHS